MKKHDEGYALVLVLVVLAVLSLVVASVLSVSLKNLQSQQSSIERMQDKYMAQGEIEKVVADIAGNTTLTLSKSYLTILSNVTDAQIGEGVRCDGKACYLDLVSEYGTVSITCVIKISGTITENNQGNNTKLYMISSPEITYESYTVTTVSSTETDGGEPQ